jgi:hypothetical protein
MAKPLKRKGELRVQVDRWPLTDAGVAEHVLTVIIVGAYPAKPDTATILQAISDAATILREPS